MVEEPPGERGFVIWIFTNPPRMTYFPTSRSRSTLRAILETSGLARTVRTFRPSNWIRSFLNPELRQRQRAQFDRVRQFRKEYQHIFMPGLVTADAGARTVLIVSRRFPTVEVELALIKALEIAGLIPVVLIMAEDRFLREYYELASVKEILFWGDYLDPDSFREDAETLITRCRSVDDLLELAYGSARVGKVVVATALRQLRLGWLDFESIEVKRFLTDLLTSAMASTAAAQKLLRIIRPELMLSVDIEYMPQGELFDVCLANGIDVIKYEVAHRNNALIFKRYNFNNRNEHYASLSPESWRLAREMEWTDTQREELRQEIHSSYATGDWYGICGTQFHKRFIDQAALRKSLNLSPTRKTAFIFPHIPWDSSGTYGKDLFRNYEDWFVETLKAAGANDQVNWVVKIHPAHVGKSLKDRFEGEPAEITAIRKYIGKLPAHISLIPAESDLSTFSLFALMDYCLTVRGTTGIEAASLGIPVLTAGTGRYDQKGFTIDSKSRTEYLERIARIQDLSPLTPSQRELAERFAYANFLMRPLQLTSATFEFTKEEAVSEDWTKSKVQTNIKSRLHIAREEDWHTASDLMAVAHWVKSSTNADFLSEIRDVQRISPY